MSGQEPVLVNVDDLKSRPVSWLWPGRIPLAKVTLLGGDPDLGKSFLTMWLAAQATTGAAFPDGPSGLRKPASVLVLSAEDDAADTIRPRLEAHGADLSRVKVLDGVRGNGRSEGVDLDRHMPAVETAVRSMDRCRLIIVDPITAYLGAVDGNSNGEVRGLIRALSALAGKHGPAVVCVTHLNKNGVGKAVYRMMGSLAFVAAARVAYYVTQDRADESLRVIVPAKANLAINPRGMSFRVADGRVRFEAMDLALSERDLDDAGAADERTMLDEGVVFLRAELAAGPVPSARLFEAGQAAGLSQMILRRAKKLLDVRAFKMPVPDGGWCWALRGGEP